MKRMHDSSHLTELFVKAGLIAALAAVLLMPMTVKTHGNESAAPAGQASPLLKRGVWEELRLPPIPHLETMPWLVREQAQKSFKIDTLLAPRFEIMGPVVVSTGNDVRFSLRSGAPAPTPDVSRNG